LEVVMKKHVPVACVAYAAILAAALVAQSPADKVLYVYDTVNDQSRPYIGYFEKALAAEGIAFDESTATEAGKKDFSLYRAVLVHGMVMAFTTQSPVRDWLKEERRLDGKKVALLVTANRWLLGRLYGQLTDLLKKDKAETVDAVSAATKDMDAAAKEAAVRRVVASLR
jgi:hypothetical protein